MVGAKSHTQKVLLCSQERCTVLKNRIAWAHTMLVEVQIWIWPSFPPFHPALVQPFCLTTGNDNQSNVLKQPVNRISPLWFKLLCPTIILQSFSSVLVAALNLMHEALTTSSCTSGIYTNLLEWTLSRHRPESKQPIEGNPHKGTGALYLPQAILVFTERKQIQRSGKLRV